MSSRRSASTSIIRSTDRLGESKPCRPSGRVFEKVAGRHQTAVLGAEPVGPVIAVVHFPEVKAARLVSTFIPNAMQWNPVLAAPSGYITSSDRSPALYP
jgi:hypothetical protein